MPGTCTARLGDPSVVPHSPNELFVHNLTASIMTIFKHFEVLRAKLKNRDLRAKARAENFWGLGPEFEQEYLKILSQFVQMLSNDVITQSDFSDVII